MKMLRSVTHCFSVVKMALIYQAFRLNEANSDAYLTSSNGKLDKQRNICSRKSNWQQALAINASKVLLGLCLLCLCSYATANDIHIIQLKYRSASSVIPVIRPLLGSDDSITGDQFTLIIRTDPQRLVELQEVINHLDIPAVSLNISVRRDHARAAQKEWVIAETKANTDDNTEQHIRVLEGSQAFIATGEQIPYTTVNSTLGGYNTHTEFKPVTTGFYVIPVLTGHNYVRLTIQQQTQTRAGDDSLRIGSQNLSTTLTAKLGEWVNIGGSEQSSDKQESRMNVYTTEDHRKTNTTIWLKVDRH